MMPSLWRVTLVVASFSCVSASFLFGGEDPILTSIKGMLAERKLQRTQLAGWSEGNTTQMGNWTFTRDPQELSPLLRRLPVDLTSSEHAYYHNLTGFFKGEWSGWDFGTKQNRSIAGLDRILGGGDTPAQGVNLVLVKQDRGGFDWLGDKGRINFNMDQEHIIPGKAAVIRGSLGFERPPDSGRVPAEVEFDIDGLHFLETGALYLLAYADEEDKVMDIRDVLGMVPPNEASLNLTVAALDSALETRIERLQKIVDSQSYNGDTTIPAKPSHNCSLHIYARLSPAGETEVQLQIDSLETELDEPTGISTITPPPLQLSATVYSPECQFVMTASNVEGLTKSRLWHKAIHYAIALFVVLLIQAVLLVHQMEASRTPSGLAKVSYQSFAMQSLLDVYILIGHLGTGIALNNQTTRPLMACGFMGGMLFLAFDYRYTLTVFKTQSPETSSAATAPPPAPAPEAPETPTETGAAPNAPAAQQQGFVRFLTSSENRELTFVLCFSAFIFFSSFFPMLLAYTVVPFLHSFWIPQIYRNVQRGTRRAIKTRCLVGITACRLFIPVYFLACPSNVLFMEPSRWVWVLVTFVVGQMLVLMLQDLLGPHFFIPRSRRPTNSQLQWEWHPSITADVDGLGDCAICLTTIEEVERSGEYEGIPTEEDHTYPPEKSPSGPILPMARERSPSWKRAVKHWSSRLRPSSLRQRRTEIMVAPCNHAFHTACLERWLMIKTECPSCRGPLPPV